MAKRTEAVIPWVAYNPITGTYDTRDGTHVASELADNAQCVADVLHIANIRAAQRAAQKEKGK